MWLGAGIPADSLIGDQGTLAQFFPSRNPLLVLFLLGSPAFPWWTGATMKLATLIPVENRAHAGHSDGAARSARGLQTSA